MMHAYAMYAERPSTTWSTSQIQTWDQTQTSLAPKDFRLAYDGGTLRAFFHRVYVTAGTFAVATRSGASWSFSYGKPTYSYDTVRRGGDWHAIVAGTSFGDTRYLMGAPGAWTRDEALTGFSSSDPLRLAYTPNGDVYIATITRGTRSTSYNMKLGKRTGTSTWSTIYDVATTGTCVYPVAHEPLALAMDEVMSFEDGFDGASHRWLRAHRLVGSSWAVEDVADLSWLDKSCSAGSASWRTLPTVTAADQLGQPHILYPSQPDASRKTLTFEDHYRDTTGWHMRTFPITNGTPLDMKIDTAGTTHILAIAPSTPPSTTRLLYIRITKTGW